VLFRTFDPTVIPGARMGRPDHDRLTVLDEGVVVIKLILATLAPKIDALAMNSIISNSLSFTMNIKEVSWSSAVDAELDPLSFGAWHKSECKCRNA
jgi:hypothetical protein